ncbi:hypothetical protein GYH30_005499 [Glycine max]|nr:hypothetical protein GYH30_005499 [Glycine max]
MAPNPLLLHTPNLTLLRSLGFGNDVTRSHNLLCLRERRRRRVVLVLVALRDSLELHLRGKECANGTGEDCHGHWG